jgi:hypothetical protein
MQKIRFPLRESLVSMPHNVEGQVDHPLLHTGRPFSRVLAHSVDVHHIEQGSLKIAEVGTGVNSISPDPYYCRFLQFAMVLGRVITSRHCELICSKNALGLLLWRS